MRVNSRVQKIWLRLLGAGNPSQGTRIETVEEGYYAVVHEAIKRTRCHVTCAHEDFRAVKPFIPNLDHTRAVYLNQESNYELAKNERLRDWAGQLGEQVEQGARHAFAIVDVEIFALKISTALAAPGWRVEHAGDNLRVNDGRFTESVNLLRAIVQMVLSRSTYAEAARSLKAELGERFLVAAQLFGRFEARFAQYRPAILGQYFTVCPDGSRLAAGWDYWQISNRDAQDATAILEQAMEEFETLLALPQEEWLPALTTDCCQQINLNLKRAHD